ncbi:MAG: PAS domain-containing protein, partial [Deltaproteobacteria bacterium]|nr:PAS domain-containing protein [Deltaproteobacteria bacterium]
MARKPTYEELKQSVKELENESLAHKETGKALRASEEKMAGIMSSITDHMSMMDNKHNIVWANNVAKKLFGQDLVGKKCYRAYHGYDSPCEPCVVSNCFDDGKVHEHETVVTREDGGEMVFWCVASVAERHSDGRPKMVVEISRDITGRKRVEEELKATRDDLEWWVKARTLELEASN